MSIVKRLSFAFILMVLFFYALSFVFEALRPFKIPETLTSRNDSSPWKGLSNTVLNDLDTFWASMSEKNDLRHKPPQRSIFFGRTNSACNGTTVIEGPAYCLNTNTIVMDEALFQTLSRQLNTLGHLAVAYAIAHQYGHHVQNLQGRLQYRASGPASGEQEERLERQADCFAGIWLKQAQKKYGVVTHHDLRWMLGKVRIWGGLNHDRKPASAILEEDFSQGDARSREQWFFRGLDSGELARCRILERNE